MSDVVAEPGPANLSLHEWACLRTELVWIYEGAPAEASRHATFDHREGHWVWGLTRGEVTVRAGRRSWRAAAGQWLLLPSAITRQDFSGDARLVSVRFLCQWPSGEPVFADQRGGATGVVLESREHPGLRRTATRLLGEVERRFPGDHRSLTRRRAEYPAFLRCQSLFLDWLGAWYEARAKTSAPSRRDGGDPRAHRVARLLNEASLAEGYPDARVRAEAGLSAVQLARVYRAAFGFTPHAQWERRRLEAARLWLETSEAPMKELAADLGFSSAAHFVVWFGKRTGATPGRWREKRRGMV